ncbi:phosphonate ABC transporter substrate-binding protein [Rhodoferax mekongensis]|uniref:Phosphonate ABC transporter substrate-binding protein n=1 Tax=Rhodoferax mekongensis TaxID=3068341 RepID=A0ABZ0AXZ6_9BURK|nr:MULTISPECIES: phosphonate ABC transporter substrate-binding protein [unclassified Rhodoferax]MDT7514745.1 phosphonate ABC transporter substrate-binding protein [Rhodoferax sp. TBRC 17199]WNO04493.1 phosphonate ABC transporter substrate-binding protein [Rhodoferax sp. TBRC 17307]
MLKKIWATSVAAISLGLLAPAAGAQELNFGIISTESSQQLKQQWQPVLDALTQQTGLKVNAFFAPDYAGVIEGMRFNKVQFAWFGNKSAMEAVDRANGEVFAKVVNIDGTEGYYSHLIVHRDSALKSVDDVLKNAKNLNFGNGDPNSTSGFLVPGYYVFAKNNVDTKSAFKVARSANHETNAMAVANKQVDVATNNSETLAKLEKTMPEKVKELRIVWTSPLIASDPLVWRKDLPDATKAKLKAFFTSYGKTNPAEREVMAKLNWSTFKESNNSQLLPIRQLDMFSKRTKVEADTTLAEDDKKRQLAELDKKLAELK